MKRAYPNFAPDSMFTKPIYNLNKWLEAMREIYTKLHFGDTYKNSFGIVTANWDEVEKRDFESWLEYYQSNSHTKYKKANFYVNDNIPGYFIPNMTKSLPPAIPDMSEPVAMVNDGVQERVEKENKRKVMEDQRKKIIGRLHAAIKHLTSQEGHMLAGDEFEKLLSSMYELLKQIQTVNKVSVSNQLYKDLIIRQANKLSGVGFLRSAAFLQKFAQNTPSKFDMQEGPMPIASKPGDGVSGTLENQTPPAESISAPPPAELEEDDPLDELSENLETAGITDANFSEDDEDLEEVTLDEQLAVEAQLAPMQPASQPAPPAPVPAQEAPIAAEPISNDLEVSLPEETDAVVNEPGKDHIDSIIDTALSNITIKDVVKKIEDVNAIFQNRTIARELSIIDLMLSNLGLSSYFNNLSEIIQKNHEASNYSISRLSDILTKLRGAISSEEGIDLTESSEEMNPEVQQIKDKLQLEKDKEENRREMRKQLQNDALVEELKSKETPQEPTPVQTAPQPSAEIAETPTQVI